MITSKLIFKSDEYSDYLIHNDETDKEYLVSIDNEEQSCYCTCPDFKYRKDNLRFGGAKLTDVEHHCKHIKIVTGEKQ